MKDSVRWWTIGLGGAVAVGSFLPWAQSGVFRMAGTDGDGAFTAAIGGAIVLIGIANRPTRGVGSAIAILGVTGLFISGTVANSLITEMGEEAIGGGLMLTLAACLALVLNGIQWRNEAKLLENTPDDPPTDDGEGEPSGSTTTGVQDRLARLSSLLNAGSISQEEHDRRRVQILDEI